MKHSVYGTLPLIDSFRWLNFSLENGPEANISENDSCCIGTWSVVVATVLAAPWAEFAI